MAWEVLILGGGFAGLTAARRLERELPPQAARVTLVNDVNFMLYTPLLPGAAGGTLEPRHVVVPLREELRSTRLFLGEVLDGDPARKVVRVRPSGRDDVEELRYDHLVVALGATSRTLPIPGLKEHARGFKTLSEAIALRNRVVQTLEQAENVEDDAARTALLTYVVVGAGYAGLEGLAELQDFASDVVEIYPRCRMHGLRFILVEAKDRVMSEISADLARFAEGELRRRGIEIATSTTVERVSADSIELSTGEVVPTRTVCWTAGVTPHPVVARLGLPLDAQGRLATDRFCQVRGFPDVWAIGDAAAIPDPARPGQPSPPTAQHGVRQAKVAAHNVVAAMGGGRRRRPFRYRTLGVFVDMGRHEAVASTMGIKWRGFPAWFLARTYHLAMMPGTKRRIRLLTDWTVGLIFGRDASDLGQLGHPPRLDGGGPEQQSSGGTTGESRAAGDDVESAGIGS
ncbi:MAG: NAD(P)/FAD-dependent oxidoreductase [Actinomycetota bacterium]|nr:NAD(P)/FAD-dependent oxidoreductase [Actinomycetota bacterium]